MIECLLLVSDDVLSMNFRNKESGAAPAMAASWVRKEPASRTPSTDAGGMSMILLSLSLQLLPELYSSAGSTIDWLKAQSILASCSNSMTVLL